jgi:hypothetical protein
MARGIKTFFFRLEEHNGEREYNYDYLIYAHSEEEAWQIARSYASDFYGDGGRKEVGEDRWEFDGGALAVEIETLQEESEEAFAIRAFCGSRILNPHNAPLPLPFQINRNSSRKQPLKKPSRS